jgi:D-glycero-D-manno-heptose 1,7-bisphosphate phosphatase
MTTRHLVLDPGTGDLGPVGRTPAIFLDRDGVLNRTFVRDGVTHPPEHLGELELLPGVVDALELLATRFPLIVVTNQPDVARRTQTWERVEQINTHLRQTLPLRDLLTCYHDRGHGCPCRKPKPGLILEAARRWSVDLRRSFLVGDRWSDVAAGREAGCRTALVVTPYSGRDRCIPDRCVVDLPEAAAWILGFEEERGPR